MTDLDMLCINAIRTLSIDAVQKAGSGHPGLPLDAAPMGYVLWQRHLKHNPKDPHWPDRDRFVLSGGHGSMLLYSLLHLTGYDLTMDDMKSFRQWESRTPGHPEMRRTPGLEVTTGPLGQGNSNAVGMAIAERMLAHRFNRPGHAIVDHYTFSLLSDGDMMEGVSSEAASVAGHLKLGKLVFLYDSNMTSLDGPTSMTFTEDVGKRYEAYGWQVFVIQDGNTDVDGIDAAIRNAKASATGPSLIIVKTTIGYGSPHKAGTYKAHGTPLGEEEVALTKQALGWDPEKFFYVPDESLAHFRTAVERGRQAQDDWGRRFDAWAREFPDLAEEWRHCWSGTLPDGWDAGLPEFRTGKPVATRSAAGKALNAIAVRVPWLVGGDADLSSSTKTRVDDGGDFDGQTGAGRNLHFGVREHAMGAIVNGMASHGGVRAYASTFLVFSDYMRPAVRLAALSELPVIFVWTHDSVGLGEDGPTHQPIEHLMSLRAIPGLMLVRPSDATEAAEAWRFAMQQRTPVALILSRQKLPVLDRSVYPPAAMLHRGAYVLSGELCGAPEASIIATGSEVHVALEAKAILEREGVRVCVVAMPCWEAFERQDQRYRESVLPPSVRVRVAVEAGATLCWHRYVGEDGAIVGIDHFGESAPGEVNMEKFGFTAEHVADAVRETMRKQKK